MKASAAYPPAPWHLHGWGAQALLLCRDKRLASVYFASYEAGTLRYRELIVAIGVRWVQWLPRFAVRRIWVDDAQSLAGGHVIWHLPKEHARFEITPFHGGVHVGVYGENGGVCDLDIAPCGGSLPFWFPIPSFGHSASEEFPFTAFAYGTAGRARMRARFASGDSFAVLNDAKTLFAWRYDSISLTVPAPRPRRTMTFAAALEEQRRS